jgi:putative addiction module component (TIGR02574 family)
MVRSTDDLAQQLLQLAPADRARLAEFLLASLDADRAVEPVAAVEAAWVTEGERRLADLRAGTVAGIPSTLVFSQLRAKLNE